MSDTQAVTIEALEAQAKELTARMNAVSYIGQQSMWMYQCAYNILKQYEGASNIDVDYKAFCADVMPMALAKSKACDAYAEKLRSKLKYVTDALAGE